MDLTTGVIGWQLIPRFAETPEAGWLAAQAYEYGFALSYPDEAEHITGFTYEPWRYRYIGRAAMDWQRSGLTVVEFLRAHASTSAAVTGR